MKDFIVGLFKYISDIFLLIPFHTVRLLWYKTFMNKVGNNTEICRHVDIRKPRNIKIGNHSTINKNVVLDGRGGILTIGNNVDIAQDCRIWTLQHDYNSPIYETKGGDVTIEDFVWLASGTIILPNIKIGKGAVVATGAIVTKDVEPYSIVAGIPAKKIGNRNSELSYKLGKKRWFS